MPESYARIEGREVTQWLVDHGYFHLIPSPLRLSRFKLREWYGNVSPEIEERYTAGVVEGMAGTIGLLSGRMN